VHDPSTVVGTFPPYSWRKRFTWLTTLVTLWHEDPCLDGSDDYCGYSRARLSDADHAWVKAHAAAEWRTWFGDRSFGLFECSYSEVLHSAWIDVRAYAAGISNWTPLQRWELSTIAYLASNPIDDLRSSVWAARNNAEGLEHLLRNVLRVYRTSRRRWWQEPRWHVSHWRFQFEQVLTFKRWAFSRCHECHGRFTWREVANGQVINTQWDATGPRWFTNAERILHFRCHDARAKRGAYGPPHSGVFTGGPVVLHGSEGVIPVSQQAAFMRGDRFRKDH